MLFTPFISLDCGAETQCLHIMLLVPHSKRMSKGFGEGGGVCTFLNSDSRILWQR